MKNKLKRSLALSVSVILLMLFALPVSAVDDFSVLTFGVSSDGYAVVADCDSGAHGTVIIPESVEIAGEIYNVKYIGEKAFDSCYSISEVHIPEGVTVIRNYAFRDCVSLKNVYVPESLVMCQYDVFEGCGNLTVHCYTSNYQFFTVYGVATNIDVIIIDAENIEEDSSVEEPSQLEGIINKVVQAIRNLIDNLKAYFGADDEFDFPFADKFPFIDDLINQFG